MTEQTPYEKLGVSEDASFDEIQNVRSRLLSEHSDDSKHSETIEAAYDAILMDRLKMRQEGKIKVPERIRFPDRILQVPKKENIDKSENSPQWLSRLVDQPSSTDVLLPGAFYLGLSGIVLFSRAGNDAIYQLILIAGVGVSVYFLNRKEGRLGRSVLLSFGGMMAGLILGVLISPLLLPQLIELVSLKGSQLSTIVAFISMWIVCSFFK
ncbi:MAG: CPP1-like family protein [Cyanobacteria bacterium P01_A01_bin.45]